MWMGMTRRKAKGMRHEGQSYSCLMPFALRLLLKDSEAVVVIAETRIKAAAGGVAADLDLVSPGAAAGGAARADSGSGRVAIRRDGVVIGRVPVAAPFVHVVAHIQ